MFLLRDDINEIKEMVMKGHILCFPTDTVWALGCDATNNAAVEAVRATKGIPEHEGLVVLVNSVEMLKKHVFDLPPRIETLISFHQRPFTLIYHEHAGMAPAVAAADGSVAVRVCNDPFCAELIELMGVPLVASIAAEYGAPFPATFGGISSSILGKADYVVKHRQDDKRQNQPSPLARLDQFQELEFIRE